MTAIVSIQNATKDYRLRKVVVPALRGVTLEVSQGEFLSIAGPSGSGKTTLLNLIGCIDRPSSGRVEVCGRDMATLGDDAISEFRARKVAFIFQNFNLFPVLSAYENVEYPLLLLGMRTAPRRERVLSILEAVGLADHARHRPNQLSGGQKQRVAIARALVKEPELVLADEPTANLDSRTGAQIIELMHRVQRQEATSFVFSTHDPQLIAHAEEVYTIRDGKLIEHRSEDAP